MQNDTNTNSNTIDARRGFLKKAGYVAPVVMSLPALPAMASSGSSGNSDPVRDPS